MCLKSSTDHVSMLPSSLSKEEELSSFSIAALEHSEFSESASSSETTAMRRMLKGEFLHNLYYEFTSYHRTIWPVWSIFLLLIKRSSFSRCLTCLQQVKHEYALVKSKLEALFNVSGHMTRFQSEQKIVQNLSL